MLNHFLSVSYFPKRYCEKQFDKLAFTSVFCITYRHDLSLFANGKIDKTKRPFWNHKIYQQWKWIFTTTFSVHSNIEEGSFPNYCGTEFQQAWPLQILMSLARGTHFIHWSHMSIHNQTKAARLQSLSNLIQMQMVLACYLFICSFGDCPFAVVTSILT